MFFMVLDLRLTKIGTQRSPFFYIHTCRSTFSLRLNLQSMYYKILFVKNL